MTITLRQESATGASTKGSALTYAELDNNFIDLLNASRVTVRADSGTDETLGNASLNEILTLAGGTNITTAITSDSAGEITLTINSSASGGITDINAGTNIDVTQDSAGNSVISLESVVDAIELKDYKETIYTGGSTTGTITPDVANGNIQKITLTGNITLNALGNPETGHSLTLIVIQPSSGGPYTLSSTMKFAGGANTLSTGANDIDIISIVYDGTNYYASLSTDFS
jgi:hypothetical protein